MGTVTKSSTDAHGAPVIPRGESASQEALARIWAEVLRLPSLESGANFFDIGGDSLKAMDVIMRVSEVFQVDLPMIAFFEDPTVSHLAAVVDELRAAGTAMPIMRFVGRREFPLSYSQQLFWLLEQQNPGTGIYNTHRIFRIRGAVDAAVLEQSLNELRRRHEILQVRFIQGVDGPVQVTGADAPWELKITDLSALERTASEQSALKLALDTVRAPFNLKTGPVLRAGLIQLAADDCLLCIAMHHAVSDGFTGSILLDDLGAIYDAIAAAQPNSLPALDLHFTDYAAWEQEVQGSRFERELEYWRSTLNGAPSSVDLPTDFARGSELDRQGHLRSLTVPGESLLRVRALAQANGTTLFTVLAAALRILLNRWSGQADFLIGTVASNRSRTGTDRMAGCFVNPLPLRNPITDGKSLLDILNGEKSAIMDAFANQDCPFAKIVEAINPERTGSDNPLFNVALVLQNFPVIALSGRFFQAEYVNFDAEVALLDLRFPAIETPDGLQLSCEYRSLLFSEKTIDALLQAYAEVLMAMASCPAQPVATIALPDPLVRQAAAARRREQIPTVAIAASFTAEPMADPLKYLLSELGMKYRIAFAPYQQVFQQLLDPASLMRVADGFAIVLIRFEDCLHGTAGTNHAHKEELERLAGELIVALREAQRASVPLILCFCPASRALAERTGWRELLGSLETKVADAFAVGSSVYVVRSAEIVDLYPSEEYEDEYAQRLGNVPYTTDLYSAIATVAARRMWGIAENRYKVIAMDCDQVLWSGRCGEGKGVAVDEPRRVLLNALLEQRDTGMLLCLCSRNREEDVWAALQSNPEIPLQRDDIIAAAINYQASSENLGTLAQELGLALDSFVFLNADPVECSEVEERCPEVLTVQVPAAPGDIPAWLKHVWAFDRFNGRA
jgi:acyl carrier protein